MKAFFKVQSNQRTHQFQHQIETYATKLSNQYDSNIQFDSQKQRIDRIHGKKKEFFERVLTGQNWHNPNESNSKDPFLNPEIKVEEQLIIGKSLRQKNAFSLPNLQKNQSSMQVMEALMRAQGVSMIEFKKQPFSRTFYKSMQKGNDALLKSFTKMSSSQQNFLKIQRPNTDLLRGKEFKIKKSKIPYLRTKDDEDLEKKQIEKIMSQIKSPVLKKSPPTYSSLNNLLLIKQELLISDENNIQ